jgi:alkylated DNA nucleotide flippase Atl1
MPTSRTSFELFSLHGGVQGTPARLDPASFSALGALELQDIERWIREQPLVVGEELKVITNQFAKFEGAKDRLDVLALDRAGRLVVIEVKRDTSGSYQDLQALRYAAFVSTFRAEQLVEAYVAYVQKSESRALDLDDARGELEDFIESGDLDVVDEDEQPRIILVAAGFQSGVTSTVLWLRRAYRVDISCVQLVPYEVRGEPVIGSSILIPLPEAGDYEVKVAEKLQSATKKKATQARLDHEAAKRFIASIPTGRWSAYVDVAKAGGSPKGAMGVGSWLSKRGEDVPRVYRVLNALGEVSEGWTAVSIHLPPDPDGVRELLRSEGIRFDENGRADPEQRWTIDDWESARPEHVPATNGPGAGVSAPVDG